MQAKLFIYKIVLIGCLLAFLGIGSLTAVSAEAASVSLAWNAVQPAPEGYRLFARQSGQSYNYTRPVWQGASPSCTIINLQDQTEYFFVVRAFSGSVESANSNEVRYVPPASAPTPTAATPTISPNGDTFSSSLQVSLASATSGAVIYYTTNGNTPTTGSILYSGPFTLTGSATVRAVATAGNHNNSAVASASFTRSSSSDPVQPPSSGGGQQPYGGSAWAVPGIIQAEDYDLGGQGVAYHDNTSTNLGGEYRPNENVDIWYNPVEGYYTGGNASGEWRNYTISVQTGGTYSLDLRVATPHDGRRMRVTLNGSALTGPIDIPNTGAWNAWDTVMTTVSLNAGTHVLRVIFDVGGLNFNWMEIEPIGSGGGGSSAPGAVQQPYGGSAWAVPGVIEAENYDLGGQGVAYHDNTSTNLGGQYRAEENVDIWHNPVEGHYVGGNGDGEWREYTVDVATSGQYRLDVRVAAPSSDRQMRVALDGVTVRTLDIPNTGAWNAWRTVSTTANLSAGRHVLRITIVQGGFNLNWIDIY